MFLVRHVCSQRRLESFKFFCEYILITNFCALIIIYSSNINLLYMFRASSTHLQEDTVVHVQHMVLSLSMRVPGGL